MIRNLRSTPARLNEKDGDPRREPLLKLAAWYRTQAERAGSLWVWEARLQRAEDLEAQARRASNLIARDAENLNHDRHAHRQAEPRSRHAALPSGHIPPICRGIANDPAPVFAADCRRSDPGQPYRGVADVPVQRREWRGK